MIPTLVVTVGSSTWWHPDCAAPDPACADPARALSYADDDAWRAARLFSTLAEAEDVRVLTRPDASTRDREFPGGPPGEPTAEALVSAARSLLARGSGPQRLVVYIAAHGTSEEVFLDDGRHPFGDLRARIHALLQPGDELLLVSDACLSARWRGEWGRGVEPPDVGFPPVSSSPPGVVEVAADSLTPEHGAIRGGLLSYLTLSGLLGAADADGDGTVVAQELSDFLHAYAGGLGLPFTPVVRSPGAVPTWPMPSRAGSASLLLDRAVPTRWIIATEDGLPLVEAQSHPGSPASVRLPPGDYVAFEIPVELRRDAWRLASESGRRHVVTLGEGQRVVPGVGEPFPTARFRGAGTSELPDGWEGLLEAGPRPIPQDFARYHALPRGGTELSVTTAVGHALDGRALLGAGVRRMGGALGAIWVGGTFSGEVAPEGSTAWAGRLAAGAAPRIAGGTRWAARGDVGLGVEGALFALPDGAAQASVGPTLLAGAAVTWTPGASRVGWVARAGWAPAAWLVESSDGSRTLAPDLDRVEVGVGVRLR